MSADMTRRQWLQGVSAGVGVGVAGFACGGESGVPQGSVDGGGPAPDAGACGAPTGAQTEGPFYPGEPPARMSIVGDRSGVALALDLTVLSSESCQPVAGAEVDVWSADASGDYSGYADFGTVGQDWLRGQQITDADGVVRFAAIVPGSYPGRAVHLHVKVRAAGAAELTTQVYLPDDVVAEVLAEPGYDGAAQTTNGADGFFADDTLLEVSGNAASGLSATGTLRIA